MKIAVVVFVKTPGYSPLKTRLAADIGREAAEKFFIESVRKTEKTLMDFCDTGAVTCYWAVKEPEALNHELWMKFESFAEFEEKIIKATHSNHLLDEELFKLVKQRFEQHVGDDGAHFLMPIRVDLLRKED